MLSSHPSATGDIISLELSKLAARRIRERPEIVSFGLDRIEKWVNRRGYSEGWAMSLHEWKDIILTHDAEGIAAILEMDTQEGQRLRSSMPFIQPPFFTEQERLEIIDRAFANQS